MVTAGVAPTLELPFADDSAVRRVHGEGILLLGGGRALLMQIAHPSVARGVAEHSSFRKDRLQRLLRTLRPMFAIVFGTRDQAVAAAMSINRTHDDVHGDGYDAHDPELLLWVWATLVDTALELHGRFVRPLWSDDLDAYYRDIQYVGELLGVPSRLLPSDVAALDAYVQSQVASLQVSDEARRIARQIFRPLPPQWAVMWPLRQLTSGLLPPSLRDQYGLTWGPKRQLALDVTAALSRRLLPFLPRRLRKPPGFLMPPRAPSTRASRFDAIEFKSRNITVVSNVTRNEAEAMFQCSRSNQEIERASIRALSLTKKILSKSGASFGDGLGQGKNGHVIDEGPQL